MSDRPYITERTQMWSGRDLKPFFVESIKDIEEFGYRTIYVGNDNPNDSWTYTTGVFDSFGKPELITVGLRLQTAQAALDEAIRRLRKGIDLTEERQSEIVGHVDVEFRSVDLRWRQHLMLHTEWFYEGANVPVLQLIYPDLQNRFPGDPSFDETFAQPIFSDKIKHGSLEHEFWKAQSRPDSSPPLLN
jgi:Domain of unknown function (DUF4262)